MAIYKIVKTYSLTVPLQLYRTHYPTSRHFTDSHRTPQITYCRYSAGWLTQAKFSYFYPRWFPEISSGFR